MTEAREGYILVAVLGTLLVLAGLVAAATRVAQSGLMAARADEAAAALEGVLRGGLELAAARVFVHGEPFGAVNGRPIRLAGGTAVALFSDGAARIDVNAADPALLGGAFRAAGLDAGAAAALTERLVAMRGSATRADAPLGAPDTADAGAAPGTAAASGAAPNPAAAAPDAAGAVAGTQGPHTDFPGVADFLAFAGLDRDTAARLARLLTVSNPDGRVDVMTADRGVLMALPGLSAAEADTLLDDRRAGAAAVPRLKAALGAQASFVKFAPGPCYGVTVTATDALGRAARRRGVVAAPHGPGAPFDILAWEPAP